MASKEFRRVIDSVWPVYDDDENDKDRRRHITTAYFRNLTDQEREELK